MEKLTEAEKKNIRIWLLTCDHEIVYQGIENLRNEAIIAERKRIKDGISKLLNEVYLSRNHYDAEINKIIG